MNDTIHGLILKQSDYRDASVLLSVLSREYGKLTLSAAGIRRMTSRNAGSVLPYTYGAYSIDYRPERTMFRLKSASAIEIFRFMHEDLTAGCAASVVSEAADALTPAGIDPSFDIFVFERLLKAYRMLNEKKRADLVTGLFLSELLAQAGIAPETDGCVCCHNPRVTSISVKEGGFLCAQHARALGCADLPVERLRSFRLLCKAGLDQYDVLAGMDSFMPDVKLLIEFLSQHAGITIRSYGLFERVFSID